MKSTTRNGIRLGLVAGLAITVVGVSALTVSGEPSTQQQVVVGELVLTVPGGTDRTGTVEYFAADANGDIDDVAEATQMISAAGPCVTITNTGAPLLRFTTTPGGSPVLPNSGLGVLTGNQNCGTSGVIAQNEALKLSLDTYFGDEVFVSTTDLTVFRPDNRGGNLTVGGQPVIPNLVNGLNPPITVAGFTDTLDVSSTSSRFNKGILLRGATFTLVTNVPNEAPVANFTFDVNVLDVQFTDASTDADGTIASWSWNFGDGSALSTEQNPTHTYAESGTYTVTLTITDDRGLASTTPASKPVTVVNEAPVADFTFGVNVLDVKFTDASTDADGTVQGWSWNFGDTTTSTEQNPTHTYAEAGTYTVTLTVTDNLGLASEQASEQVIVEFDEAVFCSETAPPVTGGEGTIATTATFFRGENGDKFGDVPCEDVGVIIDIVDDDYVFWDNSNVGVLGNPQAVNGLVTIEWAPVPVAEAARLDREIDYVGDGVEENFTSAPWCTSFSSTTDDVTGNVTFDAELPNYSGPGFIMVGGVQKAPWCLVSDERLLDGGEINQTVVLFGGGDPRMR